MKKLTIILLLLTSLSAQSRAQDMKEFSVFAKKQKMMMLNAYAHKDIPAYRKALNDFLVSYGKLSDKDKGGWYGSMLDEEYYLLACTYAAKGDKKNALDYLMKSKEDDYDELMNDHDLDNLRKEPRFIKLVADAKSQKSKYLNTLRATPKYNFDEKQELPAFTYQSSSDPDLAALKKTCNLDSIAGKGTDVSQIINLMEWAHYLIPHDGSRGNPQVKNAMSFIAECKRDNKTLNCRGLAILLNEVYLAEGFRSRYVTCLPKDTTDNDCHVITMVWSTSLKKWLWMDPTFMAYVMNEKGEMLSIEEVRDRLVNNKPLILNPDANRNRATSQTKSDLLENYMAKNLYKLECPLASQYNYETKQEGKTVSYMQLLPGSSKPAPHEVAGHSVAVYTTCYTNNPRVFWAAPPAEVVASMVIPRTTSDYTQVMENLKVYYNHEMADSLCNMYSDVWGSRKASMWSQKKMEEFMSSYGNMISWKYIGKDDDGTALFKVEFAKSTHAMGISLDEHNKFENFRFETSSSYIDKLLAKEL